ncbi:hypothetical protein NT6N_17100 [Oceaniferula spumae]|uniref:Serine/threonine specific protein phosphatases domain-containing protein n=1 Tax=Oceaniferula spumae TaxID=2979115 RepID=A0AAT9FKY8_9BACT
MKFVPSILSLLVLGLGAESRAMQHEWPVYPSFREWKAACAKVPDNRKLKGERPELAQLPVRDFSMFDAMLKRFIAAHKSGKLGQSELWHGAAPDSKIFFDAPRGPDPEREDPYFPFAEKVVLQPDSRIIVQGDLHGDIRSLIKSLEDLQESGILQGFKVADKKAHLVYTGDFVDRGAYGTEVIYTLFRLKLENPDNVHLVMGNHEDLWLFSSWGFLDELKHRFGKDLKLSNLLKAFDMLPVVFYAGTKGDFVQMNHGGIEPGYDPRPLLAADGNHRFQLLGELKRGDFHHHHEEWIESNDENDKICSKHFINFTPKTPTAPRANGFLWHDFTVFAEDPDVGVGRALIFGSKPTAVLLKAYSTPERRLRGIIRGHQHTPTPSPIMRRLVASSGAFRHWQKGDSKKYEEVPAAKLTPYLETVPERAFPDGSVWTFNITPDGHYGVNNGFDFSTYGILTLREDFKDWKMKVVSLPW